MTKNKNNDEEAVNNKNSSCSENDDATVVNDKDLHSFVMAQVHDKAVLVPLAVGSFAMIASSLSNQALPRLMGRLIDNKSNNNNSSSDKFGSSTWSLALVVLGGGLASFLRTTMLDHARDTIARSLRRNAFCVLMDKDLEWFQSNSSNETTTTKDDEEEDEDDTTEKKGAKTIISPGAIATILNQDVDQLSNSLTVSVANLLRSSSSVVFSTYHMVSLNSTLFCVSLSIVPCIGVAAMVLRKSMKRLATTQAELAGQLATFVEERLVHIALVKLANRQAQEVQDYESLQHEKQCVDQKACLQNGLFYGFLFAASSSSLLFVVAAGGRAVAKGTLTSGQLTSFCTYSFLLGLGTSGIFKSLGELSQGKMAAQRYYKLIQQQEDEQQEQDGPDKHHPPTTISNHSNVSINSSSAGHEEGSPVQVSEIDSVSFENVCFSYKSTGVQAVKDVSFTLSRGKVTALLGKNGSGKSTAANLLAGLYPATLGRIVLSDGTDLRNVNKASKKNLIQIIPQSTSFFNMSILDNVRYTNPTASVEEVRHALSMANCDDIVAKSKDGLDFVVGLNGCKLSGGERQRLALARALLSDPAVLVMDEPASSLDNQGSQAVTQAIVSCRQEQDQDDNNEKQEGERRGRRGGRALLLITHNAKSLELVDEILIMKEGAIVESGTFADLRSNPNSYLRQLMPSLQQQ